MAPELLFTAAVTTEARGIQARGDVYQVGSKDRQLVVRALPFQAVVTTPPLVNQVRAPIADARATPHNAR